MFLQIKVVADCLCTLTDFRWDQLGDRACDQDAVREMVSSPHFSRDSRSPSTRVTISVVECDHTHHTGALRDPEQAIASNPLKKLVRPLENPVHRRNLLELLPPFLQAVVCRSHLFHIMKDPAPIRPGASILGRQPDLFEVNDKLCRSLSARPHLWQNAAEDLPSIHHSKLRRLPRKHLDPAHHHGHILCPCNTRLE